jgi:hypothetical protein
MPATSPELPPPFALFRMASAYYVSRAVHVAAELGIADLMAEGPRDAATLAEATGMHAPSLRRVLRLLAAHGVLAEEEEEDGRFALTAIGQCLRSDGPMSMRAMVRLFGGITQQAWGALLHSVRTGEPAFHHLFGMDSFAYLEAHPEDAANFDQAMASFTAQIAASVATTYDFSPFRTVVDVGGGNGALLAGVLRANPALRGIVLERASVAPRASAHLAQLGLAERCTVVAGDFFAEVPAGDAYLLKHVIHDWDDARARAILATIRRSGGTTVLIVEGVYPPRIAPDDASLRAASNDVNMLVCTGGRQRSEEEFRALYEAAGFGLTRIIPTPAGVCVIEGVRA